MQESVGGVYLSCEGLLILDLDLVMLCSTVTVMSRSDIGISIRYVLFEVLSICMNLFVSNFLHDLCTLV